MAQNWWESSPVAEDNKWWASSPLASEKKQPEGAFSRAARIAADPDGGLLPAAGSLIASALPEGGEKRTGGGLLKDTAVDAVRGVVGLGQSVIGLGNLVSFGALGKGMEALGYSGEQTQQFLNGLYTADRQQADKNVDDAKGFFNTLGALAVNPSAVLGSVVQAIPQTVAAGAVGGAMVRALLPGATKAAQAAGLVGDDATKFISNYVAKRATVAAGASEGGLTAGSIAESGREAKQDFTTYAPAALVGGAVTGIIGAASGAIGRRVGLGDIEADIAMRSAGVTPTTAAAAGSRLKTIGKEALKEGVLEEAPQSFQEALATQYAQGKPFNFEEAASQAAQGLATGGVMGGFNAAVRGRGPQDAQGPAAPTTGTAADTQIDRNLDALQRARDEVYLGGQSGAETVANVVGAPDLNSAIDAAEASVPSMQELMQDKRLTAAAVVANQLGIEPATNFPTIEQALSDSTPGLQPGQSQLLSQPSVLPGTDGTPGLQPGQTRILTQPSVFAEPSAGTPGLQPGETRILTQPSVFADSDSTAGLQPGQRLDTPAPVVTPDRARLNTAQTGVDRDAELLAQRDGTPAPQPPAKMLQDAQRLDESARLIESNPRAPEAVLQRAQALREQAQALRARAEQAAASAPAEQPAAMTQFEREQIDAQRQVNQEKRLPTRGEQPAPTIVDSTPMTQVQAQQRLAVLQDQSGQPLSFEIAPHPTQAGAFAIAQRQLPAASDLEMTSPAPAAVSAEQAQNRIESAEQAGSEQRGKRLDEARQIVVTRALKNVEERGGVASPQEAQLFEEAGLGKPYDSIDESLAPKPGLVLPRMQTRGPEVTPSGIVIADGGSRQTDATRDSRLQRLDGTMPGTEAAQAGARAFMQGDEAAPLAPTTNVNLAGQAGATEQQNETLLGEPRDPGTELGKARAAAGYDATLARAPRPKSVNGQPAAGLSVEQLQGIAANTALPNVVRRGASIELAHRAAELPTSGKFKFSEQREDGTAPEATQQGKPVSSLGNITTVDPATLQTNSKADSGTISKQTHRMVSLMGSMFGKKVVVFASDNDMAPDGFVRTGDSKTIHLNVKSQVSHLVVFGHELLHQLKADNAGAYDALSKVIKLKAGADTNVPGIRGDMEELTADVVGNRFRETEFWRDVFREILASGTDATVSQRSAMRLGASVVRAVDRMVKALKGMTGFNTDDMVANLGEVKAAVTKALASYAQEKRGEATELIRQEVAGQQAPAAAEMTGDVKLSAARRGGTVEEAGEFKVRAQKDGTLGVAGDPAAIRALLPEDVKGRAVPGGMVFTTSDAPRVRAALEGRKLAYSRGGQVLDKPPMRDGKYVGAPEKYNTPSKITTLRKSLRNLTKEGEAGRYWYENSSREVLAMVGGNVQEARKFVALLAIYSPQAKVDANSTFALRAWAQYRAGQPISVKTGVMDRKAQAALDDVDAFWSGEKTGNFFFNLLREIDTSTAGKQGATIDMWMMRAGEYATDAPTATQYAFMENETNRLAQELGWEPQQVQAAIWVAMKARMENPGVKKRTEASSEKKGWIRYDYPLKNGRPTKTRVILNAQAHRDNWLKHAFQHDPTKSDTQGAKFDFSDGLRRHIGQLSWEARPGRSTGVLPGVNDAPYEQQVEFQQAMQKALLDDNGVDLLAYKLGLLVDGPDILAPGVWQGEIAAGMQKQIGMAPAKGDAGKTSVDPAQKKAVEAYASMLGLLLRQEGVGYHRPFYKGKKSDENAVNLTVGRTFTPAEAQALWGAVDQRMRDAGVADWENGAGLISSPGGMRVVNFGAIGDNVEFRKMVADAAETLPFDEVELQSFSTDGDLMMNDWKENPNGEGYRSRISEAYGPDLLDWAGTVLAPRVQSVFNEFSSKYGWGNAGDASALFPAGQQPAAEVKASEKRTDTPEFKEWFGDSMLVDENGEPLTLYHGTQANNIRVFQRSEDGALGPGIYLTQSMDAAGSYAGEGGTVEMLYARMERPLIVYTGKDEAALQIALDDKFWKENFFSRAAARKWAQDQLEDWAGIQDPEFSQMLKDAGYDGVILGNPETGEIVEAMVPSANQVKSNLNDGEWSRSNPDIYASEKRTPLGFYSALADGVDGIKTNSAPAQGWKDAIKGLVNKGQVKADEVEWSGIEDFLEIKRAAGQKVTKAEVAEYLRDGGVRVEEVVLVDQRAAALALRVEEVYPEGDQWTVLFDDGTAVGISREIAKDEQSAEAEARILLEERGSGVSPTSASRYDQYTLPGAENYREVLLTLPGKVDYLLSIGASDSEVAAAPRNYRSRHWDQANVLAHIRVNDRTDADGKRVLFVEELQSDWGQEGKKKGFKRQAGFEVRSVQSNEILDTFPTREAAQARVNEAEYPSEWKIVEGVSEGIPAAPFVTKTEGWLNLALKRIMVMAAEGGYDKVAFVNGEQSADRYDLSKQVDELRYGDGMLVATKGGTIVTNKEAAPADLPDLIGKEAAERLLNSPTSVTGSGYNVLSGVDLKVGGEGMKTFYDQIVPLAVKKLLPKVGGEGMTTVDLGGRSEYRAIMSDSDGGGEVVTADGSHVAFYDTTERARAEARKLNGGTLGVIELSQPGFDVTDAMLEKVAEGLPLFSEKRNIFGQKVLATWTAPTDSKLLGRDRDSIIYKLQDKQIDMKRVIDAIKSAAGGISDKWNAYLQEELYHGRTAKQTKDFLQDELKPLVQGMQLNRVSIQDLEEYLHNRHAQERNAQIAKINPAMPDGGSGIDTADARAYLAALDPAKRRVYESLAKRVDAITKETRELLVRSGLETRETIDAWEKAYGSYVPLFRDDIDYGANGGMGTGQGFSVRGPASKRATGSKREVVDILANVAMQRERAVVRAEKTRVGTALYGLAVQSPNTDFWLAVDPKAIKDVTGTMASLVNMGLNPLDVQNIIQEPKQTYIDPRTGLVTQRVNPALRSNDNVLAVRVNGEDKYVFFNNNDPRAKRMVESLKNLDANQLGEVMALSAKVSRYFASVNTQYNPIFGAINLIRDTQGAAFNLTTTPIADRKTEVMAGVMPAVVGIYADLRSRRAGKGPTQGAWAQLWEEFQDEGGQTGFRDMFKDSTDRAKSLQSEIDQISEGKLKQAGRGIFNWLSDYNETLENAVRLSAYKAAKDKGLSNQQAASIAKNLTVNFNRKGEIGMQAGALYAFFNASVQGTARLAETLKGPAGKKILAGGLLLGVAQALALAAAGFKDDEPPDFIKERNLVIPTGDGKYVTIPMPLGLHIIPNTSRVLTEWALSGWKKPTKRIAQITGAFLDAFNPVGNAGWSVQTIAPTFADPLVALAENRDWTGKPIAKEDRSGTNPTPGYTRAKDTASWLSKELSYYLNLATGGTKYTQGLLSPTPDQIDYLIGQVTGGVGREALKIQQTVESSFTGEELPSSKVPILGRFYGDTKEQSAVSSRFFDNITKLNEHENEIKGRIKNREGGLAEYRKDNPEAKLVNYANAVEREVSEMRRRKRELLAKNASPESIKILEERITRRMKQLNDRVEKAEDAPVE